MADPNPAATVYADTIAIAATVAMGPPQVATDELLTITGTLGGTLPEHPSELPRSLGAPSVAAPSIDWSDVVKLAIVTVLASWIGSILLRGK
jgi:hypothetical protein